MALEHEEQRPGRGGQAEGPGPALDAAVLSEQSPESIAVMAALVSASDDAIISKTLDGTITSWNGGAERLYGYTAGEAVGRPIHLIMPTDRLDEEEAILERLRAGERVAPFDTVRRHQDGELVDVSLSVSPVRAETGELLGAVAIARDITPLTRATRLRRQAEERYRATLDGLVEGFQVIGPDWTYRYVNPAAARHGRAAVEDLIGRRMDDVYPGIEQTPMFDTLRRCMTERRAEVMENLFTYPDGSSTWFELRIQPVPEGLCIHSVDIQDRKIAEIEYVRLNEQLEDRVANRTHELEVINAELEAFSYSVSHDLRTPLRAMDGFSQILLEDYWEQLADSGRDALRRIRAASQRMGHMIDDLVLLSRVNRDDMFTERISITDLVRETVQELRGSERDRSVAVRIEEGLWDEADARLLRLALDNLLGNAWKYTRPRLQPEVEFFSLGIEPGRVYCVRDNGVGFPAEHAEQLFAPFQRLHSPRDFEGSGIGLATVRRVIHRHGGRIWAEGREGEGASFYFTLHGEPEEERNGEEHTAGGRQSRR